jgi:hypothetical protein
VHHILSSHGSELSMVVGNATPCELVDGYQSFGGTCCLYLRQYIPHKIIYPLISLQGFITRKTTKDNKSRMLSRPIPSTFLTFGMQ